MLAYEVKCGDTWAWYPASIEDYDAEKQLFMIRYQDDWKEPEFVRPDNLRAAPDAFDPRAWRPRIGDPVECQARAEAREPLGWWGCKLKGVAGDRFKVAFDGWGEQHDEQLRRDLVRPRNVKPQLSAADIARDVVAIPEELLEWVASNPAEMGPLFDMRSRMITLRVDEEKSALVIIASPSQLEMARGIAEHIFSSRKKLLDLKRDIDSKEERVRRRKDEESQSIRADFDIHPLLIGYLYGSKRANVSKEQLPSEITSVRVEHNHCTIFGKTQEAVDETEERLHIVARKVLLSSSETWFLVGQKGKDIKQMTDHVGVMRLITKRRWSSELETLKERARGQCTDSRQRRGRGGGRSRGGSPTKPPADRDEESELPTSFDDLFDDENTIDMTNGKDADDYLVIIGRRAEVRLCETMIEMTINAVRKIAETRDRVYKLRDRIAEQKGYGSRGGGGGGSRRGGRREDRRRDDRRRRDGGDRRDGGKRDGDKRDTERRDTERRDGGDGKGKKGRRDRDRKPRKETAERGEDKSGAIKGKGGRGRGKAGASSSSDYSDAEQSGKRRDGRGRGRQSRKDDHDTETMPRGEAGGDAKTTSGDEKPPRDTSATDGKRKRRRRKRGGAGTTPTPA